jgi:hypothetical protein
MFRNRIFDLGKIGRVRIGRGRGQCVVVGIGVGDGDTVMSERAKNANVAAASVLLVYIGQPARLSLCDGFETPMRSESSHGAP